MEGRREDWGPYSVTASWAREHAHTPRYVPVPCFNSPASPAGRGHMIHWDRHLRFGPKSAKPVASTG